MARPFFFWVDGLLNIEKLTRPSDFETRLSTRDAGSRRICPVVAWLATTHFVGEVIGFG